MLRPESECPDKLHLPSSHEEAYLVGKGLVPPVHCVCTSAVCVEQEAPNVQHEDYSAPEGRSCRTVVPWALLPFDAKLHVDGHRLSPVFFVRGRCMGRLVAGVSALTCAPRQAGQGTDLLQHKEEGRRLDNDKHQHKVKQSSHVRKLICLCGLAA